MTLQNLKAYRARFAQTNHIFYTDIFSKPIWGDMGEDSASITLTVKDDVWHMQYIRTQSGEPLPLSDTVCNVIDEYEKDLNDEELFEFLAHHGIQKEFSDSVENL